MMITVIGRGHGGTRAISKTLEASGVFMGRSLNDSGDLVPAEDLYEACRVMGRRVRYLGNGRWDFSRVLDGPIDPRFVRLVESYLDSVLNHSGPLRGWKLPETTLVFPWIVRMFPEAYYIGWWRDPRDNILRPHLTDDLSRFGVPCDEPGEPLLRRALSWKYQRAIVQATPRPKHWIEVRFEDFVLEQESTLERLRNFLGIPLARIPVRPEAVGRWRREGTPPPIPDMLIPEMEALGYD